MRWVILVVASLVVLLIAAWWWAVAANTPALLASAQYVSTVVSAVALVWLVAGYLTQAGELGLQAKTLALQQEALDNQRKEIKEAAYQAALSQTQAILSGLNMMVGQMSVRGITSVYDIPRELVPAMGTFRSILTGATPQARFDAFARWGTIEGVALHLVSEPPRVLRSARCLSSSALRLG